MSVVHDTRTRVSDHPGEGSAWIVARFREAWEKGDSPHLEDYLPLHAADRRAVLVELVRVDIVCRREAGETPRLETYLHRYPELAEVDELPLELKKTQVDIPVPLRLPEREQPLLPGYEILCELGRGGMGVVYKARQVGLNRVVALKMILAGAQAGTVDRVRFRAEAEAVARLHHPNIIQIHEIGEHLGRPFFSLEYCPGGSLETRLDGRPIPSQEAATLAETLARAIHHAHQQGIVHRDLKPANVLLAPASGRISSLQTRPEAGANIPKITDFGLAKQIDQPRGQTQSGAVLGTPPYMAPEQARGRSRDIGPATDVYALGAILYECLTGRSPFDGESVAATLHQVIHDDPTPLSRLQPQVPRDLETIALKCLQKDPRRRYGTALELADDLQRFLQGEPIQARATSTWEQARRWVRRRPVAALGILVSVVGTLAVVGALIWHTAQLEAAVEAARHNEKKALEAAQTSRARSDGQDLLTLARDAFAQDRWEEACLNADRALAALGDRPELSDLIAQATALHADARHRLAEDAERADAIARFENFLELRDDALFHGLLFAGADQADNLDKTRKSAQRALQLWGIDDKFQGPLIIATPFIEKSRKDEIVGNCYELLVVLAGALAQPQPKDEPADRQVRLNEAIHFLDRAAVLGVPATKAFHLRRGRVLELLNRLNEADSERVLAQGLEPANGMDHFLVADEYRSRGEWLAAALAYEKALRFEPGHFWAQYGLACCHLRLNRLPEAKVGLTACMSHRRGLAWLHALRGLVHTELADFAAAEADLARSETLKPTDAARYAIHANRGILRYRQAQAVEPPRALERAAVVDPLLLPTLAVLKACQQQWLAESAEELIKAGTLRPNDPQAHASLALVRAKQGRVADSRHEFAEAIRLAPQWPELYRSRSEFHAQQHDLAAALSDLRKVVALEEENGRHGVLAEDHVKIGRLLQQGGDSAEALEAYARALRCQPDYPPALRLRAVTLLDLRRYEDASRSLDRYLELAGRPGQPAEPLASLADAHRLRGLTRTQLGDYAGALHDHTRALDLKPDAVTYGYRGWVYLIQGAASAALRDFETSVKLDPSNGEAYAGRAQARWKLGQAREAAQDAELAVERGPDTPRLLLNAAGVLAQVGADTSARARTTSEQRQACTQRSLSLVGSALTKTSPEDRARFWKDHVVRDPLLEPLRRLPEFQQLAPRSR